MFFRTQLLISTLLAVSSVLGAPSAKRNWGGPCERFPNGITNISGFRIAAHKPNNIDETWELVLKQTGIEAAGTSSTFTVGAWEWNDKTSSPEVFDMNNSELTSASPDRAVAVDVKDHGLPNFVTTGRSQPVPTPAWCVVPNADVTADAFGVDFLAANGRYDAWYLCNDEQQNYRIAFNVADRNQYTSAFIANTCFQVYLRVIG